MQTAPETHEIGFPAMGSDAHIIVSGSASLAAKARRRVEELERLWSRFLPHSEISRLNLHSG